MSHQPQDNNPIDGARWLLQRAKALLEACERNLSCPTEQAAREVAFHARGVERVANAIAAEPVRGRQGRLL